MTQQPDKKPTDIEEFLDQKIDTPGNVPHVPKELADEVQLQAAIDSSLTRLFGTDKVLTSLLPEDEVAVRETSTAATSSTKLGKLFAIAASLAVVAGLCWMLIAGGNSSGGIYFAQQPLTRVYCQLNDSGFTPTYPCEDNNRMAIEFDHKLGVGLQLAPLPADRQMLGLAYPGGISRETIAMLARSRGQNVLVFVDRSKTVLDEKLAEIDQLSASLKVFKKEQFGLMFYEVTPLAEPTMIDLFEQTEPDMSLLRIEKAN